MKFNINFKNIGKFFKPKVEHPHIELIGDKTTIIPPGKNSEFKQSESDFISTADKSTVDALDKIIESSDRDVNSVLNDLRDLSQGYELRKREYDMMAQDVVIKSVLEMYSDDTCQTNVYNENPFIAVSKNERTQRDLNSMLKRLNVNRKLWSTVYNAAKYGEWFWKIYLTEDGKDIKYLSDNEGNDFILDLYYEGNPKYFAVANADSKSMLDIYSSNINRNFRLYDRTSYLHFYIRNNASLDSVKLVNLTDEELKELRAINKNSEKFFNDYSVRYDIQKGESLIEGVRSIYRILNTLEDSMIGAKLAKSEFLRLYNIEVGRSTPKDVKLMVNKVKKLFDSQVSMDMRTEKYNASKKIRPWGDPIFNSVSEGKGAIAVENIGGDFQVSNIVDIDYFLNKEFAGLGVPKTFLGFEDSLPALSSNSGQSLIQQDIRYSRRILKLSDMLKYGITDLCKIWLTIMGRQSELNQFKIVPTALSSPETIARLEEVKSRIEIVTSVADAFKNTLQDNVDDGKLMKALLDNFINIPEFTQSIQPIMDQSIELTDKVMKLKEKELDTQLTDSSGMDMDFDSPAPRRSSGGSSSSSSSRPTPTISPSSGVGTGDRPDVGANTTSRDSNEFASSMSNDITPVSIPTGESE
jgi:Bacteriophage T4-like capsid assembly protein (Gp20).